MMYKHFPGAGGSGLVHTLSPNMFYIRIRLKTPLRDDYYKYIYIFK